VPEKCTFGAPLGHCNIVFKINFIKYIYRRREKEVRKPEIKTHTTYNKLYAGYATIT
jgi:hypothetical protein